MIISRKQDSCLCHESREWNGGEAGSVESGFVDSRSADSGFVDAGSFGSGFVDTGSVNSRSCNSGSLNSGSLESGAENPGALDSGTDNPEARNTEPRNSEASTSELHNSEPGNSESQKSGAYESGPCKLEQGNFKPQNSEGCRSERESSKLQNFGVYESKPYKLKQESCEAQNFGVCKSQPGSSESLNPGPDKSQSGSSEPQNFGSCNLGAHNSELLNSRLRNSKPCNSFSVNNTNILSCMPYADKSDELKVPSHYVSSNTLNTLQSYCQNQIKTLSENIASNNIASDNIVYKNIVSDNAFSETKINNNMKADHPSEKTAESLCTLNNQTASSEIRKDEPKFPDMWDTEGNKSLRFENSHTIRRKYINENELWEFLSFFMERNAVNTMILTLLYTGMRVGEMLALTWNDIDFDNCRIHVSKSLSYVKGKYFISSPKTASSVRVIYIGTILKNILLYHRNRQQIFINGLTGDSGISSYSADLVTKIRSKKVYPELVFTSEKGNYKSKNGLNKQFKRILEGTKFSNLTLHCLRHINATLLLNSGVDLKVVSEHLGHSSISTTADIYTDVLESTKMNTAAIIDNKTLNLMGEGDNFKK